MTRMMISLDVIMNHGKAKEELDEFEHWKRKAYQPKVREMTVGHLTGESSEVMVCPLRKKESLRT